MAKTETRVRQQEFSFLVFTNLSENNFLEAKQAIQTESKD